MFLHKDPVPDNIQESLASSFNQLGTMHPLVKGNKICSK